MAAWGHGQVFRDSHLTIDDSNVKCPPESTKFDLLAGHRGMGFCKDIRESRRGLFTFTALREPVERALSLFDAENTFQDKFFTRVFGNKPLKDWLKEFNRTTKIEEGEAFLRFMGSQQARFLCGYECFLPKNKSMNDENFLLSKAKQNLRKLDAIALSEKLADLIPQLKLHLRWLPVGFKTWPHANTRQREPTELDAESKAILASYSRTDNKLYKLASQLVQKKTKEAKDCINK